MLEHPALTLYHSGIVVDDLDQAMATWSAAFDLHWAPPRLSTSPLRCPAGILGRKVRLTYSIEGPQHIELLEQVEDAPYRTVVGGQYIHHLGYRTADLVGQVRRLEDLGFLCDLHPVTKDGQQPERFAYLRHPVMPGSWVELIDDDEVAETDAWLAGAAAELGLPYQSMLSGSDVLGR